MGNNTKSLIGLIIGIILAILGIVWYVVDIPLLSTYFDQPITFSPFWKILALLCVGLFGICLFFVGLILAWINWDNYKMEKELEMEAAPEPEEEVWEEEETEEEVEEEPEEEFEEEAESEDEEGFEEEVEEEIEEEEETPLTKEEELERELRAEMEKEEPEFVCDVCGKVAKTKAGLLAHKRSHK